MHILGIEPSGIWRRAGVIAPCISAFSPFVLGSWLLWTATMPYPTLNGDVPRSRTGLDRNSFCSVLRLFHIIKWRPWGITIPRPLAWQASALPLSYTANKLFKRTYLIVLQLSTLSLLRVPNFGLNAVKYVHLNNLSCNKLIRSLFSHRRETGWLKVNQLTPSC